MQLLPWTLKFSFVHWQTMSSGRHVELARASARQLIYVDVSVVGSESVLRVHSQRKGPIDPWLQYHMIDLRGVTMLKLDGPVDKRHQYYECEG